MPGKKGKQENQEKTTKQKTKRKQQRKTRRKTIRQGNKQKKVGHEYPGEGAAKTTVAGSILNDFCILQAKITEIANIRCYKGLPYIEK